MKSQLVISAYVGVKKGWGDNGEIATKMKEYAMYGLIIHTKTININGLDEILLADKNKNEQDHKNKDDFFNICLSNIPRIPFNMKSKLLNYNNDIFLLEPCRKTIKKKFVVNFIIHTRTCYNLINDKRKGNTENEINIMCFLTQICDVYYNDVYINDILDKNLYIKLNEVNSRLIKHKKAGNDCYENSEIFKPTRDYDFVFFRGDSRESSIELFKKIPEPKIYSNHYHADFWEKNIVGFQSNINAYIARQDILKYFEDDSTLSYQSDKMIAPTRTFLRGQFMKKADFYLESEILKTKLNSCFLIGIIGCINKFTSIKKYLPIISNLRTKYANLNISIVILANEIYEDYQEEYIKIYKNLPNELYLSYVAQFDIVINTWSTNTCIFSGSNKNLDCISMKVPLLCPYSISYADVIGYDYPLFYDLNKSNTLQEKIETVILNTDNVVNLVKDRFNSISKNYNENVLNTYYNQMVIYSTKSILVDYHNHFYFVDEIVDKFKNDFNVTICKWEPNGEENRFQLLKMVDLIFCEWGAENAVWYSKNKSEFQKLYVRIHRWEIFTVHFFKIDWNNVEKVIFITPEMERVACLRLSTYHLLNIDNFDREYYVKNNKAFFTEDVAYDDAWKHFQNIQQRSGKVPNFRLLIEKNYKDPFDSKMIYNYVKSSMFEKTDKLPGSEFNIGLMGLVPMIKRLDIAVDILKIMVAKDSRFKLFVLGKSIDDLPWLKKNTEETDFFNMVNKKIKDYNLSEHVIFEKYTDNPEIWMQKIGYLLSVSDIEGSHQAVAESMASGTIPFIYGGALKNYKLDDIYPKFLCYYEDSFEPLCEKLLHYSFNRDERELVSETCKKYASDEFHLDNIYNQYNDIILNPRNMKKYSYYITTNVDIKTKQDFYSNLNTGKYKPLVSSSSNMKYISIKKQQFWEDYSKLIDNYEIWDLYRHSFEWLINILDLHVVSSNIEYYEYCAQNVESWLNTFSDMSNKFNSKQVWADHTMSGRIMSFLIFHEYSIENKLNTATNLEVILTHIRNDTKLLYIWIQKNKMKLTNHLLIACISVIFSSFYANNGDTQLISEMSSIIDDYVEKNFIDGINVESSPGYQCHCLVYIIRYIYTICKLNRGNLISTKLLAIYLNVYEKLFLFLRSDKTMPMIGDTNLTLDIYNFPEEEYNKLSSMHEFICDNMNLEKNHQRFATYFEKHLPTGYIFCIENKTSLIVRTKPNVQSYHTHDDNLSIHFSHDNVDWISDMGHYPAKRAYFNSRIAHNCIVRNLANEQLTNTEFYTEQLNNKHYILSFSNNKFKHTREIIFYSSKHIVLKDKVENKEIEEHTRFNQLFHTGSNIKIKNKRDHSIDLICGNLKMSIIQKNKTSKLETFYGSEKPYLGWIAEDPSNIRKTYTLSFTSDIMQTVCYETEIIISKL